MCRQADAKYRLYIDEVGNQDLRSADNPNERFLCLTGIAIDLDKVKILNQELDELKRRFFKPDPDEPVILHRKEIVNGKRPFGSLRNSSTRKAFDNDLIALIGKTDLSIISVVIDKLEHRERYQTWKYEPYHYCLAVLAERFAFILKSSAVVGDIMAESRGGKEDRKLKDSFTRLHDDGTDYVPASMFDKYFTSRQLKIKPKMANISGLQIADILAHPCRQKILLENDLIDETSVKPFARRILETIEGKFYHSENGKVIGYGRKLLP